MFKGGPPIKDTPVWVGTVDSNYFGASPGLPRSITPVV